MAHARMHAQASNACPSCVLLGAYMHMHMHAPSQSELTCAHRFVCRPVCCHHFMRSCGATTVAPLNAVDSTEPTPAQHMCSALLWPCTEVWGARAGSWWHGSVRSGLCRHDCSWHTCGAAAASQGHAPGSWVGCMHACYLGQCLSQCGWVPSHHIFAARPCPRACTCTCTCTFV